MRIVVVAVLIVSLFSLTGCTTTQKGAAIGALGGGAAGAAIGYWGSDQDSDKAITGAAVGALTGAAAGAIIGYFAGE